ncbi:hypothetical protein [Sporosarcina jiandibaonis]|uniref:hypothetical protein n=1 Tax=Sporosarcina jiandibaonis TaxID=2715535 RepID=UPI001554D0B5|nr:hypothetical protein [Sporosarcina jiandibaonis]
MKSSLNLVFWGYLLVLLHLEIGIDIIPDPVGYFLIALGCFGLREHYPIAPKAGIIAVGLIFLSVPSVFVNLSKVHSLGWGIYTPVLIFVKLILAYFLFLILKNIVKDYNHAALIARTNTVYTFYITSYLLSLAYASFAMNVSGDFWIAGGVVIAFATFIMSIIFLVQIRAIRKAEPVQVSPIMEA